ncbi:MAG: TetR/AcrR family transcriptional regulator [Actinobacteria bacterium]|nr:TetR/AcrR family transcriptional regulator [Actinomycetota bacterium]
MRRHGWGGELPESDDEARRRLVDAARAIVRATEAAPTVAEVADALSVSRATVYRYFPSAESLLLAAVSDGLSSFLDDITGRLSAIDDAAEVVVEGIAFTAEEIERRVEVALVLESGRGAGRKEMTSEAAIELGREILTATGVDWAAHGYRSAEDLDELVVFMLRNLQMLVLDRSEPSLAGPEVRAYLRRWVGPAVDVHPSTSSDAGRRTRHRPRSRSPERGAHR